jgi:hypothetical protein
MEHLVRVQNERDRRTLAWLRAHVGDAAIEAAAQRYAGPAKPYLSTVCRETLERVRFLGTGGSSAAVVVLDAKFLSRFWPRCDWMTPLLRTRNRVADEGLKLFVALTTHEKRSVVVGVSTRPRERLVALRTQRYCEREGIGFLGTVQTDERMVGPRNACPPPERVGRTIADRLASRRFSCCDSVRIGAADV